MNTWLGERENNWNQERFPDGTLNARQLNTILTLDDRQYGRIVGTHPLEQPVSRVTEDIVEVHLRIGGRAEPIGRHCALWLDSRGEILASALASGDGRTATSYWTKPDQLRRFGREVTTTQHEHGMWGLGNNGAVAQTRMFIRKHYTDETQGE